MLGGETSQYIGEQVILDHSMSYTEKNLAGLAGVAQLAEHRPMH